MVWKLFRDVNDSIYIYGYYIHQWILKLMSKKKNARKTNPLKVQKILEQQPEKNNTLIFGGVLLAMTSIGLLIFVLSDKVFHLSW